MDLQIPVTEQLISDTITSGVEGGIHYWCRSVTSLSADRLDIKFVEDDGNNVFVIHRDAWPRIVALMARTAARHYSDMIRENGDATTGDVLCQLACFGEIKYG